MTFHCTKSCQASRCIIPIDIAIGILHWVATHLHVARCAWHVAHGTWYIVLGCHFCHVPCAMCYVPRATCKPVATRCTILIDISICGGWCREVDMFTNCIVHELATTKTLTSCRWEKDMQCNKQIKTHNLDFHLLSFAYTNSRSTTDQIVVV